MYNENYNVNEENEIEVPEKEEKELTVETDAEEKPAKKANGEKKLDMNELIEKVKEHNFVPVVDDRGCFIGIILRRDILNYLLDYYNKNNNC